MTQELGSHPAIDEPYYWLIYNLILKYTNLDYISYNTTYRHDSKEGETIAHGVVDRSIFIQ